jgi:hypothetical protein
MILTLVRKIDEAFDQLDNIESLCELFYDRRKFTVYKNIAVSLRFLLTGSSGQAGLICKIIPDARLKPLRVAPASDTPPDMLVLPAEVRIERGEAKVQLGPGIVTVKTLNVAGGAIDAMQIGDLFLSDAEPIGSRAWLNQAFLRPNWTLGKFIRTVANKDGGAHLDPNADLQALERWGYFHWHLIAGIARSLHPQLIAQLREKFSHHVRARR